MTDSTLTLAHAIRLIVTVQGVDANTDSILDGLAEHHPGIRFDRSQIAMLLLDLLDELPAQA